MSTSSYSAPFATALPLGAGYLAALTTPSGRIAEPSPQSTPQFSERHLQAFWFDDALRPQTLHTMDGQSIEVLYPGRWNSEAGPDFHDAHLRLTTSGREIRGDIEIDTHVSGWVQHGHDTNPDFANVRIHITYEPYGLPLPPGLTTDAVRIALQPLIEGNPTFSFDQIDLSAYPYSIPPPESPLRKTLHSWPIEKKQRLIRAAGLARLIRKAERYSQNPPSDPHTQNLYRDLCGVLGYRRNSAQFRQLATTLSWETLCAHAKDQHSAYAILGGISGLLPEPKIGMAEDSKNWARTCWDTWWGIQEELDIIPMPGDPWNVRSLRPLNHPRRRLSILAALTRQAPRFFDELLTREHESPKKALSFCEQALGNLHDPFWSHHASLNQAASKSPIALMGRDRIYQFFNNVLVPQRISLAKNDQAIQSWAEALAPEPHNQITREALHTFFGPDSPRKLSGDPLSKQGLLQLFEDWVYKKKGKNDAERLHMLEQWCCADTKKGTA